jgi:hypothetical protein
MTVFSPGKGIRIAPAQVFIELCTLGEGPRGHEAPPHTAVFELESNRVHVVWAGLLEEALEVVRKQPCLPLIVVRGGQDASHTGASRLPIVAVIVVSHGHLRPLLAPLFAALNTLLSAVDGNIERRLLVTAQGRLPASLGWVKHNCLMASGVWGGDTMWLPECVPKKVAMLNL